jgi:uncharacterized protein YciI
MSWWLLEYDLVADHAERRGAFRGEHLDLARAAADRGDLVLAGALADPMDRALLVWNVDDTEVITRFAEADPYVTNGLAHTWRIRPWTVVLGTASGAGADPQPT